VAGLGISWTRGIALCMTAECVGHRWVACRRGVAQQVPGLSGGALQGAPSPSEQSVHPLGEKSVATDRDEQQPEQQRQQELEEIRRSFAEMGTRMGTLFESAELGASRSSSPGSRYGRPPRSYRRPLRGSSAFALVVGGDGGAGVPGRRQLGLDPARGEDGSASPPPTQPTAVTPVRASSPPARVILTRTSVPKACVDTAKLADEVISRLTRNQRAHRLTLALRDYTSASQACRCKASP
jgi:hypothetical protein